MMDFHSIILDIIEIYNQESKQDISMIYIQKNSIFIPDYFSIEPMVTGEFFVHKQPHAFDRMKDYLVEHLDRGVHKDQHHQLKTLEIN